MYTLKPLLKLSCDLYLFECIGRELGSGRSVFPLCECRQRSTVDLQCHNVDHRCSK